MENWKRKFALLGIGQAVSILSASVLQMAIIWYLTESTKSAKIITLSTLCGYMPRAVLGMFGGALIDRYNRKIIVIVSDIIMALAALAITFGMAFTDALPIWFIFTVLAIRSVGSAFHKPALNAIIPSIVPKEYLAQCAGFLQGFESVSLIISPALAAILFGIWKLSYIAVLDAAGTVIAVLIVVFINIPAKEQGNNRGKMHILKDTKEGIAILRRINGMMPIMVISTIYAFIYFPIGSMYPLITMTYFRGSIDDSSLVEIIFSVGSLAGALVLGKIAGKIHHVFAIAVSIGVYGIGVLGTGLLPPEGIAVFMVLSGVMGITIPFFYGLRTAIFQRKIPDEYLGRVLSLAYSVSLFASPLGLILGGSFSEKAGIQNCFIICGILSICLSASMFLLPSVRKIGN